MRTLETIKAGNGIEYHKLLEFNSIVLAYHYDKSTRFPEIHYVTWQRTGPDSLDYGHYFTRDDDALNEQQSMRDFCVRSGLIRECDLLANEKLPAVSEMLGRFLGKRQTPEDEELLSCLKLQADKIVNEPKEMIVDKQGLDRENDISLETESPAELDEAGI